MQSSDPRFAYKKLDRKTRTEVIRFAQEGQPHPDAAVAKASYDWAHHKGFKSRINRLPGWLLPAVSLLMVITFAVVGMPAVMTIMPAVMTIFAAAAGVAGLQGWAVTTAARLVRGVHQDQPHP